MKKYLDLRTNTTFITENYELESSDMVDENGNTIIEEVELTDEEKNQTE